MLILPTIFDNVLWSLGPKDRVIKTLYKTFYLDADCDLNIDLDDLADMALADTDVLLDWDEYNLEVHPDLVKFEQQKNADVDNTNFSLKGLKLDAITRHNPNEERFSDHSLESYFEEPDKRAYD